MAFLCIISILFAPDDVTLILVFSDNSLAAFSSFDISLDIAIILIGGFSFSLRYNSIFSTSVMYPTSSFCCASARKCSTSGS